LERERHELCADGIRNTELNPLRRGVHTRGYFPHVKRESASYFVTYRFADSLPKTVLLRLEAQRAERLRTLEQARPCECSDLPDDASINQDFRRALERYLDADHSAFT
jgi:hypothetical protein